MNEEWELEKKQLEETIKTLKDAVYELQKSNDEYERMEAYKDYNKNYNLARDKKMTFKDFKENFFYDMEKCSMCGEWFIRDDMVDTEEMVNSGIGYVCEGCKENM